MDRLTSLHVKPIHEKEVIQFHGEEDGIFQENKIFIDAILGNERDYSKMWDGYVAQAMIEAAIRSSMQRRTILVLDDDRKILNFSN